MITEVVKIDNIDDNGSEALAHAAEIIKCGGLVVFPTETVYGLGGDATNPDAARKIYEAKGRPSDNPLIIHISSPDEAENYAYTNDLYYKLADSFMPGPLTLILKAKDTVPLQTRGGLDTVAVRCPEHPIARELIRLSGVPIAAPSANLSGSPSPTKVTHVREDMDGRVEMIIDGGDTDFGLESTILKIDGEVVTLLRPGKITRSELEDCIGRIELSGAVTEALAPGERVLSPGMKYRHYAPRAEVVLIDGSPENACGYIASKNAGNNIAIISYTEHIEMFNIAFPSVRILDFGSVYDELEQAHRLFSLLRDVDSVGIQTVYAPLPKKEGVGLALYNRMIRAAAYNIVKLN